MGIMDRLLRLAMAAGLVVSVVAVTPAQALAVAPANAPTILSPGDGASVGPVNPVLSWTPVSGASRYRVQISATPSFSGTLLYNQLTYATKATPPGQLPFGTLYWRVAGSDGSSDGPYASAWFSETLSSSPLTQTPTDGQTLTFPTEPVIFSWDPVPGAISYTVEVDSSDSFVSPAVTQSSTKNTSFTPTDTKSFTMGDGMRPQLWYWHVRANFPASQVGPYSTPKSYSVQWPNAPLLESPANGANVTDVVLSWDPVPGAQSYEIQIDGNGDWQNLTIEQDDVMSTRYSPYVTLPNGSYYWHVRARAAGTAVNWGSWSADRMFTRSWPTQPVSVHPYWDGVTVPEVSNLEFSWTPLSALSSGWVDHAAYYQFQLSENINFSGTPYYCMTDHTTISLFDAIIATGEPGNCNFPSNLTAGNTYYWRVQGMDSPASPVIMGAWDRTDPDETQRFIYEPDLPDLISPADGSTVSTPVLRWSPVDGADHYQVWIEDADFNVIVQEDTYDTTYTTLAFLDPADGPFWWSVYAMTAGDVSLRDNPNWFSFDLVAPTTSAPPTITVLTPGNNDHGTRMPPMQWRPVTGAAYYLVWYQRAGMPDPELLEGAWELPFAAYTYTGAPFAPGNITWTAEAYDSGDQLIATSDLQTFLMDDPADAGKWIIPWYDYVTPECVPQTDPYHDAIESRCSPELGDTQELRWAGDPKANTYVVYIAQDAAFSNIDSRYRTTQTTLTPAEALADNQAGHSYYWFVRPCTGWTMTECGPGPDTNAGRDNASAYKKVSPPVSGLSTTSAANPPVSGSTLENQVTFNWTDYIETSKAAAYPVDGAISSRVTQEAKRYRIQVSTASNFPTLLDDKYVDQTQYTPWALTYPEGPLYWRVQAYDGSDLALTMSATGMVTKQSPQVQLSSPSAGGTVTGVPSFTWQPQNWAAKYRIEIYENADTNWSPGNRLFQTTTYVASWSPTNSMPAGVYAWRVQRQDAHNLYGPWSEGRLFTLSADPATLISPADGSTLDGGDMLFTWTGVQNAVNYRFETSVTAGFSSPTQTTTSMTSWSPTTKYTANTYYWRVSVLDASNNVLSTSGARSFVVGSPPGAPTGVQATAGNASATVTWTAPASAGSSSITSYVVTSSGGQTCTSASTSCTVTGLTNGTSYTFTVQAVTAAGAGPSSSASNAVVPLALVAFQVTAAPSASRNVAFNVTVRAVDSVGSLQNGYLGSVHFTSSDAAAVLPADYTFLAGDGGQRVFSVTLRSFGTLSVTATDKANASVTGTASLVVSTTGATFVPLAPTRLLDTREGNGLSGVFAARVARTFQVTGRGGVPANAVAVTGNLTVTQQTALGYLFIGPVATNAPTSSTLNFPKADNRANAVTVQLGAGGTLSITYYAGIGATTQVIFDVTGYFTPETTGATYVPLDPTRLLDTRSGNGLSGAFTARVARTFQVTGRGGVPAGAVAVTGNLTVTGQTALGYLFIGPVATNAPTSSTLNFPRGDDRANAVTVQLGAGGTLSITYYAGIGATTQVIFDVTGYFTPDATGATYVPLDPTRLLDTRSGNGLSGAFTARAARTFQVTGRGGVPAGAVAVTGNLTVTGQTALGYLFMGPVATNAPTSSTLNFPKADNRANSLAVKLGTSGTLSVTYYAGTGAQAHVIFDVSGYFSM
jgi:hypothetical protein